jgi:hypothetical protein
MSDQPPSESETVVFSLTAYEMLALVVVSGLFLTELAGFVPFETAVMVILVILSVSHLLRP